jgi:hypothetical protein
MYRVGMAAGKSKIRVRDKACHEYGILAQIFYMVYSKKKKSHTSNP